MKNGRAQAKDVPEAAILALLRSRPGKWHTHWDGDDPTWNLPAALPELRAFPEKVLRAKLSSMARRRLVHGCGCGCRGDWHVLPSDVRAGTTTA